MMERQSVFKRTTDEWWPAYEIKGDARVNKLVEVSFLKLSNDGWRVCIWGADDFGLEKDFVPGDRAAAYNLYLKVILLDIVNQNILKEWNFVPA